MRRLRRSTAAIVVACLTVGVGCSGDDGLGVQTEGTAVDGDLEVRTDDVTTTTAVAAPVATAAPGTASGTDDDATGPPRTVEGGEPAPLVAVPDVVGTSAPLGAALLVEGPVGWAAASEDAPDLGALTVVEAAGALGDPEAELALLTTRRLRTAHARRWLGPDGATATVVGYAFADAEGALAYEIDSFLTLVAAGATESRGAERSRAFRATVDGVAVEGRALRRQERLYVIVVRGGPPELADALVTAQAQRLGG